MEEISLNNGIKIPPVGLGTYNPLSDYVPPKWAGKLLRPFCRKYQVLKFIRSTAKAIKMGYRLIDTSTSYGNEKYIKWAIRISGINRKDLFITTRISNQQQWEGNIRKSLTNSLKVLGLTYIDLYMFHWPVPDTFIATWKEMEVLYKEGPVKAIGVANCHQHHLETLLAHASVIPAVNQFEIHPLMSQKQLIAFCKSKGIVVEAYTPIGRNHEKLMGNVILQEISNKYQKTIPQIILRWHYQNGVIPVPRSSNAKRLRQNIFIFDFHLTLDEMEKIDSININLRLRYDPDNCDFTKL